jgi:hypothetical protein
MPLASPFDMTVRTLARGPMTNQRSSYRSCTPSDGLGSSRRSAKTLRSEGNRSLRGSDYARRQRGRRTLGAHFDEKRHPEVA